MRQLCKHGIDHDHACQQCDLASLSGFGAPAAAPDAEARLSEEQLAEMRRLNEACMTHLAMGGEVHPATVDRAKLLRELDYVERQRDGLQVDLVATAQQLDAVRRERDEARGLAMLRLESANAAIKYMTHDEWVEYDKGLGQRSPAAWLSIDSAEDVARLRREEAERRGFAQGVEAAVTWLKGRSERDFGYWFAEKIARALQFAGPSPAELQPPPEGTIEPDETSDFGATPEDGYRAGFREGAARAAVSEYERGLDAALAALGGGRSCSCKKAIRSLKGKPAGPAGREGGA